MTFPRTFAPRTLSHLLALFALFAPVPASAQDRLTLAGLQQAAIDADPRLQQLQLLEQQSALRTRNISALRLPTVGLEAQLQYQSDVPHVPAIVAGRPLFQAPKDTYDSYFRIDQRLLDPTVRAQAAVEAAQLAEQQSRVRSSLHGIRQQVNDAFFFVASLQERIGVLDNAIAELQARLREMQERVNAGTALPSDAALIEVTLLQRQQEEDEVRVTRLAALARLGTMTGIRLGEGFVAALPDLAAAADAARKAPATVRARPEVAQFARTRERLARQEASAAALSQPRISAYARLGYGKPGLNFIGDEYQAYGVGGVRLQWNAWNWGSTARERQAMSIQQQIVLADEEAFAKGLVEAIQQDAAQIDRLERALASDARIIVLREQVEQIARTRMQEAVITPSEHIGRFVELTQARMAAAQHRVELAQARARLLTTLGVEIQ